MSEFKCIETLWLNSYKDGNYVEVAAYTKGRWYKVGHRASEGYYSIISNLGTQRTFSIEPGRLYFHFSKYFDASSARPTREEKALDAKLKNFIKEYSDR